VNEDRQSPKRVHFEGFQLDLHSGELASDAGKTVRLPQQPFRILAMLLERPGEVLTREDIRKELWPDNTIVEFEHSISAAMNRLRQALGDSAEHPRYIETLARRGYRWMPPVEWADVGPARNATHHYKWLRWAAALVAVIGLGGGIRWFVRPASKIPESPLTITPLTAFPGYEGEPSFSPDGNQVAFTRYSESATEAMSRPLGTREEAQGRSDIYVKLIGTDGPPIRLTTDPASAYSPAWSPDGRFIAFRRDLSPEKASVLLIPALGGPERKIAEVFKSAFLLGPFLAWSPDGNSLVISDRDPSNGPAALFLLAIDTGEKRRLTSPPPQVRGDSGPAISPDGRTLAFSRMVDASADLYLVDISDRIKPVGEAKQVALGNLSAYSPAWTEDGREIVFRHVGHDSGLWRIPISVPANRSAEPRRFPTLGENAFDPAISRRGNRLAYSNLISHSSIWRIPRDRYVKNAGSINRATPFIFSTRDDVDPQFSPDGKRIAFSSTRSGNWEIWLSDIDGSNPVQLTFFSGPMVSYPRWSPDGGRIAFDSDAEGEFDIWVTSSSGGKPQRLTTDPANDGNPNWSRDGRWIYFDSARTGEQQVWKIPATGGDAIQITRDGGFAPHESPNGKFIYYTKDLAETSLWRLPVEGGQATKMLENLSNIENLVIGDDGIYFVPEQGTPSRPSIQYLNLATNQVGSVASFRKPLDAGLTLSPDGRWILYTQVDQGGAELRLVANFR
jgi:Tol biopolymer transport system component/DNA-binding winged helix-turn-helix (wHTH) protein